MKKYFKIWFLLILIWSLFLPHKLVQAVGIYSERDISLATDPLIAADVINISKEKTLSCSEPRKARHFFLALRDRVLFKRIIHLVWLTGCGLNPVHI